MWTIERSVRPTQDTRLDAYVRRGQWLQYVTIGWNTLECVIAVGVGLLAGSVALVGFGLDSAIEVTSSLASLWRLAYQHDEDRREQAEQTASRIIGICFLLLACYVAYEATVTLLWNERPEESLIGLVLAALSLLIMPWLAHEKRKIASRLHSGALEADSQQTQFCAYLSALLLVGLALNAWLGWWWADPVAALLMVPLIAREGWEALHGEHCESCA